MNDTRLNRCTLGVQSFVKAAIVLVSALVGMNSAQAQNPADLIPPAPDTYAVGNTLNTTLDYSNSLKSKNPQPLSPPNTTTTTYRVIIPSDNLILFQQAKAIEPTAFIQLLDGQRVIQVGLFSTEALALQQVRRFQAVGMPVQMQGNLSDTTAKMPQTIIGPTSPKSTVSTVPSNLLSNKGFYVIIPTVATEVNSVQSQLNQVGIPSQYILFRDRPFGLHCAIGTFSKRAEAERLTAIIRDRTKFDARVYHER